jgi:hypothetical protein
MNALTARIKTGAPPEALLPVGLKTEVTEVA